MKTKFYYFLVALMPLCVFGIMPANGQIKAVDLGLSVKWASCNLGANSPEEYGDYYAWGETEVKEEYKANTNKWYEVSCGDLKKQGVINDKCNLTAKYDVATVKMGGSWRMPTFDEIKELENKCTWTWTTQNGVNGYKVTGKNGNSIFLPVAGGYGNKGLKDTGSRGGYFSSTADGSDTGAFRLGLDSDSHYSGDYVRYWGFPVRPVSK